MPSAAGAPQRQRPLLHADEVCATGTPAAISPPALLPTSAGDAYSLRSLDLFPSCRLIRAHEIDGPFPTTKLREIILQKLPALLTMGGKDYVLKLAGYEEYIRSGMED